MTKEELKAKTGQYRIGREQTLRFSDTYSSSLEEFLSRELKYPVIIEEFLLEDMRIITSKEIRYKEVIRNYDFKDWSEEQQKLITRNYHDKNYQFGFNKPNSENYIIAGFSDRSNCFFISEKGYIKNGDYLYWVFLYNFVKKLLHLGYQNIQLLGLMGNNTETFVQKEVDIADFFDGEISVENGINEQGEIIQVLWSPYDKLIGFEKGSDIVRYLSVPYKDAIKIKGFPKEWMM